MTVPLASAVAVLAVAASPALAGDALAVLRGRFGSDIEYRAAPRPELRYCPDNTCETFRAARRASTTALGDFALLYLWGVSDYTYLEAWQKEAPSAAVHDALRRSGRECARRAERQRVACTLRALAKADGITVTFIRYDEGVEAKVTVDLEQELRRLK